MVVMMVMVVVVVTLALRVTNGSALLLWLIVVRYIIKHRLLG
jgi:hypothetical protein